MILYAPAGVEPSKVISPLASIVAPAGRFVALSVSAGDPEAAIWYISYSPTKELAANALVICGAVGAITIVPLTANALSPEF